MAGVVVCLLVVMLVSAALIQVIVIQRRQSRREQEQLQSYWLAESACDRAQAMLRMDPGYSGETWSIVVGQGEDRTTGAAQIQIDPVDGQPRQRRILVRALLPEQAVNRALHEKRLTIDVGDRP